MVNADKERTEPVYGYADIAALLALMLRNLSADNKPYSSFSEQLQGSAAVLPASMPFQDAIKVASFLYAKRPDLFDAVHMAIRALLEELEVTETDLGAKWSICAFVSQEQVLRIGRL